MLTSSYTYSTEENDHNLTNADPKPAGKSIHLGTHTRHHLHQQSPKCMCKSFRVFLGGFQHLSSSSSSLGRCQAMQLCLQLMGGPESIQYPPCLRTWSTSIIYSSSAQKGDSEEEKFQFATLICLSIFGCIWTDLIQFHIVGSLLCAPRSHKILNDFFATRKIKKTRNTYT